MYRLHCFGQSGNAFKVAFLLRALGEPFEPVFVDFFTGVSRDENWRAEHNEMGEAPILEDGDLRLSQSGAILSYLADKHGRFGGKDAAERLEVLRWILFDNHKFTSYFASYRFAHSLAPAPADPAVMQWLLGRAEGAFHIVDKHLSTRQFLVGDSPTIADFSLGGYQFYPVAESGIDIAARWPHIGAWVERLRQVPGWASPYDIMPGGPRPPRRPPPENF